MFRSARRLQRVRSKSTSFSISMASGAYFPHPTSGLRCASSVATVLRFKRQVQIEAHLDQPADPPQPRHGPALSNRNGALGSLLDPGHGHRTAQSHMEAHVSDERDLDPCAPTKRIRGNRIAPGLRQGHVRS